ANFKENVRYEENVTLHAMPELSLSSYPNPFTERLFLSFQLEKETEVSILLFDPTGHLVQQIANQKPLGAGTQEIEINTQNINACLYHYQVIIGEEQHNGIVVKIE
ncbi:MAG: T9SS type A sorting domain-containing protein, partial [Bacteroidota bacterium]